MAQPDDGDDRELVVRTLAGQRDAYAALVGRYQRGVLAVAYRLSRDWEAAQDLAQEALLRAYRALATYDQTRPFAPWLYRIVTNLGLNDLKRRQVPTVPLGREGDHPGAEIAEPSPGPEALVMEAEFQARLWQEVAALPPDYRAVIELRHVQQRSYQEIAHALDIPLSSVKSRLYRARQWLRARLEAEDEP